MNRYAVSYIDWYNYNLTTKIVNAFSPREAILQWAAHLPDPMDTTDLPENMEEIKQWFFNSDSMIHAELIP